MPSQLRSRRPDFVVIDPDVCIDCAVCVMECPVDANYEEKEMPGTNAFCCVYAKLAKRGPILATPGLR